MSIPEKLQIPEITRLLARAGQLRTFRPAVAYWCEYAAVVQIMRGGLHQADDECRHFAEELMDRLERTKAARQADPDQAPESIAVTSSEAGRVMVEAFADETLARAERVMDANRVTKATADTFDAAATFYSIMRAWGELDIPTQEKIKFAKWNARRILKAAQEGRDPNESNPVRTQPEPEPEAPALDVNDPEVRMLLDDDGNTHAKPHQATVEDDDTEMPPRAMSPIIAPAPAVVSPTISVASMNIDDAPQISLPSVPGDDDGTLAARAAYYDNHAAEPFAPSPMSQSPGPEREHQVPFDEDPPALPPSLQTQYPPHVPRAAPQAKPAQTAPRPASRPTSSSSPQMARPQPPPPAGGYQCDEAEIALAQKHAKWAISALNFEDIPTAIKNLRDALAVLGG